MEDLPNDAKSKEVVRLWRAWRTVHEMVADRVRHVRKRKKCGNREIALRHILPPRPP